MGMAPSASIGKGPKKLFEPVHGSAPDIAGQGKVNPIAMILSAGLMFKYAFGREREAAAVKRAVNRVLLEGFRTGDLVRPNDGTPKEMTLGTDEMGEEIVKAID
jgi:3-isopropylmalate dehydrogenase